MKLIKRNLYGRAIAILAAGIMALFLIPSSGMALPECSFDAATICSGNLAGYITGSDCDGDGITDKDECEGFTTVGSIPLLIEGYPTETTSPLDGYPPITIDPSMPDLFYAVTSADQPAHPEIEDMVLSYISDALASDPDALTFYATGVKVSTHRIKRANSGIDRELSQNPLSKARLTWIMEDLCTGCAGNYLGNTEQGVPSDYNAGTIIYSQKIIDNVDAAYSRYKAVVVAETEPVISGPDSVANYYILQVMAHEMGHGSDLVAAPDGTAKNYYHYKSSSLIMAPSVSFSKGVYSISVVFDPQDPDKAQLVR